MKGMIRAALAISGILAATGCNGASGPKFSPATSPADRALIYIYRPGAMMGRARVEAICLDGDGKPPEAPRTCQNVIRNSGYFVLKTTPGQHHVWAWKGKSIDMNVESGKSYYLRFNILGETFDSVPENEALKDLRDCNLSTVN